MTEQILKIADDLRRLALDEQQARTLLLGLLGVSSTLLLAQDNDIKVVGNCANCGVEYHIHMPKAITD